MLDGNTLNTMELEHGGRLAQAAKRYGIPLSEWLDLSTGINPEAYPVGNIPLVCWQQLPQDDDGLRDAAKSCYGGHALLAVAGSQAAIQTLPLLRNRSRVGVLTPAYFEHEKAWRAAGHDVVAIQADDIENSIDQLDVLVVVNPNNPTGERFSKQQLLDWHQRLQFKHGWLIIDEAFMDVTPEQSLASCTDRKGLIVLRSIGKFFGLAGIRLGFVLAEENILHQLQRKLGPWTVSGPARYIAIKALQDIAWQKQMREQLTQAGLELKNILAEHGLVADGGTALFQWFRHDDALELHESLAALGILTRYFPAEHTGQASIRFGLPGLEADWNKLNSSLSLFSSLAVRPEGLQNIY